MSVDVERYQDPRVVRRLILRSRTIAVVGLSSNVLRPSYFVAFYLQRHGYRIIPVNPREEQVLGEVSRPSLSAVGEHVDVVDVFRVPDAVPGIAEEAVAAGAGALWLQYGVISEEGAEIAGRGGLDVVMDRCMRVEHARALGRMHGLGFNSGRVTARRDASTGDGAPS